MSGLKYILLFLFVMSSLCLAGTDTITVDTTFTFDKCNYLEFTLMGDGTNYGSDDYMYCGVRQTNRECVPLMGLVDGTVVDNLSSSYTILGDTCIACTLYYRVAQEQFDAGETVDIKPVKQESWTEDGSCWAKYDGSNAWGTAGAKSSGTDYHAWGGVNADGNGVGDIKVGLKDVGDSICAGGGYSFDGLLMFHNGADNADTIKIRSDDGAQSAYYPTLQVIFEKITVTGDEDIVNARHTPAKVGIRHSPEGCSKRHGP